MTIYSAIAEPRRREILDLLRDGELGAGAIVDEVGLAQPTVSQHLKVLREAGLVEVRADANRRMYRLRPIALIELEEWLDPYRRLWAGRLDALEHLLDRELDPDNNRDPDNDHGPNRASESTGNSTGNTS